VAKILLVAPICNGEDVGEAWVACQWARRLAERHDITLLTYSKRGATPATQQLSGMRIVEWLEPPLLGRNERLNSIMKPAYVPFYFRARRWIINALERGEHFDIVHQPVPVAMRYPSPAANLGLPLVIGPLGGGLSTPPGFTADENSSPWFMKLRALDSLRMRWDPLLRSTYQGASCILGIAEYVREHLAELSLQRFEVMSETGLDDLPPPIDRCGRRGPVKLLYVGRLVRTKGARDILRAMASMGDLDVELDIVGDGPERAECERLIAAHDLGSSVRMHGWKQKAELPQFYRHADIFVFPSYREPGGNVALEAMSFSLPLIVVDRGGPGSATSEKCAVKLSVTTPEALAGDIANAVRMLASNTDLRLRMGAAAYGHVAHTALWSAKLDRIDAIYADLISMFQRQSAA
jgi:glycosyltransferase involved in cell wall biosynthesis